MKVDKAVSKKRLFKAVVGILLVCVCLIVIMLHFSSASEKRTYKEAPFDNMKFDEKIWKEMSNNDDPDNKRGLMYDDLKMNKLSEGMTKQTVITLLGEPDGGKSKHKYSYNLGMWSGYRMDYDSLEIEFDKNSKINKVYMVQH